MYLVIAVVKMPVPFDRDAPWVRAAIEARCKGRELAFAGGDVDLTEVLRVAAKAVDGVGTGPAVASADY